MKAFSIITGILITIILFASCGKRDDDSVETIVKQDTIFVHDTVIKEIPVDSGLLVYCVRHAETTGGGTDPHLSAAGMDRAARLAEILTNDKIDAVYSTDYFRTKETAIAVADDQGLTVINYDPGKLAAFSDSIEKWHKGDKILIVGHSNTTPDFINLLTGKNTYKDIDESEYDNLFIINKNSAESVVTHLKY